MKKLLLFIPIMLISSMLFAQGVCEPPIYNFNNKSNVSGNGGLGSEYRFNNVLTNVNAIITITRIQNASVNNNNMDNASPYAQAWQPFITFPNSRNSSQDTSYIEFKVEFKTNALTPVLIDQSCMAMTIIDCDGNGNGNTYREMVKVSLPGTPLGIANSTISVYEDDNWMLFKSGPTTFNSIDSINKAAMAQVNFPTTTNTFYMRVGVVGPVSANTQRQFSFYFKSFTGLEVPLPVKLSAFTASLKESDVQLNWTSTEELNFSHYEIYRSTNGSDFESIALLYAQDNHSITKNYSFVDANLSKDINVVYYKLKLVDLDGSVSWTSIRVVDVNNEGKQVTLGSVYPNPAGNQLYFETGKSGMPLKYSIRDVYGKEILKGTEEEGKELSLVIDLGKVENGLYTLVAEYEDGTTSVHKFIKQ